MNRVTLLLLMSLMYSGLNIASGADARAEGVDSSWHSPSLIDEMVTGPNDAITTRTALEANERWGITPDQRAEQVIEGVYALRGWGIASTFAIEAPDGWIIVDTGDSTRAANEMRATLEQTLGQKIRVSAILLTHWHYADGNGVWLDEGTEIWGHEHLDRNRSASTGISVKSGVLQSRAIAQFGIFHPLSGPDAAFFDIQRPDSVPPTTQDRAYTSPIWYSTAQ